MFISSKGTGVYGLIFVLFVACKFISYNMFVFFLTGTVASIVNVSYSIFLQKEVAKEVVGRIYSLDMSLSNVAMIFSIVMTTALGDGFFKHCSYPDICRPCHRNQSVWLKQDGCA